MFYIFLIGCHFEMHKFTATLFRTTFRDAINLLELKVIYRQYFRMVSDFHVDNFGREHYITLGMI